MAGGGESLGVKGTAIVLGIGVVIGLVLPEAFDSDPTKSGLRAALEQEVSEGATGNPMSNEARLSWSSGQGAEELDGDDAQRKADGFYAAAEAACHADLNQRAAAGAIGELVVPVAAAAE